MKKLFIPLLSAVFLSTAALAGDDHEVLGRVTAIDGGAQTFQVTTPDKKVYDFASTPMTEYEIENKVFSKASYLDLKQGQWVKVEYVPGDKVHTAKEVDIFKNKK